MKRALAIPIGLSLFGLTVASFVCTRSAHKIIVPARVAAVAPAATLEVASNDDYLPPLLGIFDEQELPATGAFTQLASFTLEEPRALPFEILRQRTWPSAQPGMLLQVGYDNPMPLPLSPSPKMGSSLSQNTSILIPDLSEPSNSSGAVVPSLTNSSPIATSAPAKFTESLIRPKPFAVEPATNLARTQVGEPPLAGVQPTPQPGAPGTPQHSINTPVPAALQPTPATNLAEYTGCGCQPRIGSSTGFHSASYSPCAPACVYETPLCCQSFSSCCQPACGACQVVEMGSCCGGGDSRWRPFSKIRSWFRGEQRGSYGYCEESCFDNGASSRKPLFNRFRSLFNKNRDECVYFESCDPCSVRTTCCGQ